MTGDSGETTMNGQWRLLEERLEITPHGLEFCFEREEFLKNSFDVDRFIVDRKKRVALETLKDDLMAYLRILKSSLVELINQDYADFVNLSTNLVGLDKAITSIQTPMEGLQADINEVNKEIAETIGAIEVALVRRQEIRNQKTLVLSARSLKHCVDRIELWLDLREPPSTVDSKYVEKQLRPPADSYTNEENGDEGRLLERIGTEYTKLQHLARKCGHHKSLMNQIQPRIHQIKEHLHTRLDSYFVSALPSLGDIVLTNENAEFPSWATQPRGHHLRTALRTFVGTDRSSEAMVLLRRHLIDPLLDREVIKESRLTNDGIGGVYDGVLSLLSSVLVPLRRLMVAGSSSNSSASGPLAELDLVADALWPSVVERLASRLPQIFSAGRADVFHSNYIATMKMMESVAAMTCNHTLKKHPATIQFLAKWTLPVYMQLRFQEVASSVEEAMSGESSSTFVASPESHLASTCVVLEQLRKCWQSNVYLPALAHRFWKLSLQLLSRYVSHVKDKCNTNEASHRTLLLQILDCQNLIDGTRKIFSETILLRLKELGCSEAQVEKTLEPALEEGFHSIKEACEMVVKKLESSLHVECTTHLRLVQDVPRQYRKTNREAPMKPSVYATNVLRPLTSFVELNAAELSQVPHGKEISRRLTVNCVEVVGNRYHDNLSEVLQSVRKMEDSLRLLRKARGQATNATSGPGNGLSDDAKIRQQLLMDARHFKDTTLSMLPSDCSTPSVIETILELTEREAQT